MTALPKEEAGKLLDQRFHVLTSTKDLRHLTRNFVKLAKGLSGRGYPDMLINEDVAASH